MNKLCCLLAIICCFTAENCIAESKDFFVQPQKMRTLCKTAQDLEQQISKLLTELESLTQMEKVSTPVIRNIYEILARCCTLLFNMQRFSSLLTLNQQDNKNDFIRCSIIIKNFAHYFKLINAQLGKTNTEMSALKIAKHQCVSDIDEKKKLYDKICSEIEVLSMELAKTRKENVILYDVVQHIATKSESLEELDAELEAENAIGVLRNTKIDTKLSLSYPVFGKIITEFGDKGLNNEIIYYMSFETTPGAIVTSPLKGVIVFTGRFLNYGNMVIISNGEYRIFLYGIDTLFATSGDVVDTGDYIGRMGKNLSRVPLI
ncbi:MAG: M23 family metallopeptidase, partial [Holosporaceae bacterium]|nr:M23 family metallopeptidase [Holosporaceae bacterium]